MTGIRLQDTLTGDLRPLEPLEPGHVRIYSCGPTVYGPAHVGNFRSFLFADLLVRYLRYRGLRVTWVMNLTDIDDKIIRGAAAEGISHTELADRYAARFLDDADALGMTRPGRPSARDRAHPADHGPRLDAARARPRLPHRRRLDLLPDRVVAGVRRARAARPGGDAGGGAGRGRRVRQGRRPRLRAVEGPQARRAVVVDGGRRGPPGLAHRVLRDEHGPPRPVVRHPHRRRGPRVPAPRGRDRPVRGGHRASRSSGPGSTAPTSGWAARRWPSRPATSPASAS